ncbi:MAG: hypothetical protein HOP28_06635 [Gemmatimonadales bacterium]|nr:hypothetical protein [Gemmatimonadales bacterium]
MRSQVYAEIDWEREQAGVAAIDDILRQVIRSPVRPQFSRFLAHFQRVQQFEVDQTGFSAMMLYFLYAVGVMSDAKRVVGIGLYAGISFCTLTAGARDANGDEVQGLGLDENPDHVAASRLNAHRSGLDNLIEFIAGPPRIALGAVKAPIDLFMLDVHHPVREKDDYLPLARQATPLMRPGSILLAHDACVPRWQGVIDELVGFLRGSGCYDGPWTLPVDSTGILVAVRR